MSSIVVVSDAHIGVNTVKEHRKMFSGLARLLEGIAQAGQRFQLVFLGDIMSFDSCSFHESPGTERHVKLPSLQEEIEAYQKVIAPFADILHNMPMTSPVSLLMGNHEDRFERWRNLNHKQYPFDYGSADIIAAPFEDAGIQYQVLPYKEYLDLELGDRKVGLTHIPHNVMGKPIGGIHVANRVARESGYDTTVFGHTHQLQIATFPTVGGFKRTAISAPAFMPHGYIPSYAKGCATGWEYGCLVIDSGINIVSSKWLVDNA